jgi:hypothetical protein
VGDSGAQRRGRPASNQRLIVWGERREEPDWDGYLEALLDFCIRKADLDAQRTLLAQALRVVSQRKR